MTSGVKFGMSANAATLMDDIKTSLARLEEKVEHIQKVSVENLTRNQMC